MPLLCLRLIRHILRGHMGLDIMLEKGGKIAKALSRRESGLYSGLKCLSAELNGYKI